MEESLTVLHDLFAAMKKDIKTYVHLVEPRISNPSNDYERMLVRKALGIENARKKRVKGLRNQLRVWLDEESSNDPTSQDYIQLYANVQLEHFALRLFSQHIEEAILINLESSTGELNDILQRTQSYLEEVQAVLLEISESFKDEPIELEEKEFVKPDKSAFSVGSLL